MTQTYGAKKYSISIKQVIECNQHNGVSEGALEDKGILINSKPYHKKSLRFLKILNTDNFKYEKL